jgi:bifunctional UDP-N-acetylglucosamine pyrophosphorylase / glucosamine-1-phosphate N-acetyltransferase
MTQQPLTAIILAAGKGTRMKSDMPKVLHTVAGLSMIGHTLKVCKDVGVRQLIVIIGHHAEQVKCEVLKHAPHAIFVEQTEQLGTGHAVNCTSSYLRDTEGDAIILYADTPLITKETIEQMQAIRLQGADSVFLGFETQNPANYGRLIISDDDGELLDIVEAKEATPEQLKINLCNSGVILTKAGQLPFLLSEVNNNNAKGEYYLTDIVKIGKKHGKKTYIGLCDENEVIGVNSRAELAHVDMIYQTHKRIEMMNAGVTLQLPQTIYFSYDTQIGNDTVIEPYVYFGVGVVIESNVHIKASSYLEGCYVGEHSVVGPFARLRPQTSLGQGVKVGNFVEIKKSVLENNAKVSHLSYIGDSSIGKDVNIGAGTITCNYDGVNKYRTVIEHGAFIGSNTSLVAPVIIGKNALVGAGSVITHNVPENSLALARGHQVNKENRAKRDA